MFSRWKYEQFCREAADTILYEEALKIVKQSEQKRAEGSFLSDTDNMNTIVYTEFARRNKHQHYYDAFNQVQRSLGRNKAVIN